MSELLPCPFCGSIRVSGVTLSDETRMFREFGCCEDCGASTTTYATKQEAIDAWNTRHERTCENVYGGREFECSECGMQWHLLDRTDATEEWAHVRTPGFCPNCGAKVVTT